MKINLLLTIFHCTISGFEHLHSYVRNCTLSTCHINTTSVPAGQFCCDHPWGGICKSWWYRSNGTLLITVCILVILLERNLGRDWVWLFDNKCCLGEGKDLNVYFNYRKIWVVVQINLFPNTYIHIHASSLTILFTFFIFFMTCEHLFLVFTTLQ